MLSFFHDLRVEPRHIAYTILDRHWRTENFSPKFRVVPYCRLHIALGGEAHFAFSGREYLLSAGKMILIPPNITTQVWCEDHCEVYWAKFNVFYRNSLVDIFSLYHPAWEMPVQDMDLMKKILAPYKEKGASFEQNNRYDPADQFLAEACLRILLMPFLRAVDSGSKGDAKDPNLFFPLLQYIESHPEERFTLRELGRRFNLNPTYLTNLFARQYGFSLIEYCNKRKLRHAEMQLLTTDMTVSEIAYGLGFSSADNFSRLFKRWYGMTPGHYRKNAILIRKKENRFDF